jgi:glycosyltransferase involved in cell wall biosynthesis
MRKCGAAGAKMRIAVWHNLPSGGGKRALYYHVRGLVERGHLVEAWCPSTSDRNYLPLSELITEHVVPIDIPPERKFLPRGPSPGEFQLRQARALDGHCQRCADAINRGDFDILFANSSFIQAVSSIGRYVKTKKVLYLQEPKRWLYEASEDGLPWLAIPPERRPWIHLSYMRWFLLNLLHVQQMRVLARNERFNARAFDVILVNSYFSRESLLRVYGLDSQVCYMGVDANLFVNHRYNRENFVVGVGQLSPHKNVEFVIKALSKLGVPRPRLVWIANMVEDWYYKEMRSLAELHEVSFEIRTMIDDNELVNILNRAAVMVYAPRLEPFGFAALEANACGLPVVAVAEGGVRESIIDGVNGLLVPHQPEAMADAIQRLVQEKNLAAQLGENGAKIVREKWSVDAAVDRLERQLTGAATSQACSHYN